MREQATHHGDTGKQAEAIQQHRDRVERLLERLYVETWAAQGLREVTEGSKFWARLIETKDSIEPTVLFDRLQREWVRRFVATEVTKIAKTTQEQAEAIIRQQVALGVTEGWTEQQIADRIRQAVAAEGGQLSQLRGRMIARTEVHNSSEASSQSAAEALQEAGIDSVKEWVSAAATDRSREDHLDMDGETVELRDWFVLPDGTEMLHPGDPNAPAEHIINCRCVAVHTVRV